MLLQKKLILLEQCIDRLGLVDAAVHTFTLTNPHGGLWKFFTPAFRQISTSVLVCSHIHTHTWAAHRRQHRFKRSTGSTHPPSQTCEHPALLALNWLQFPLNVPTIVTHSSRLPQNVELVHILSRRNFSLSLFCVFLLMTSYEGGSCWSNERKPLFRRCVLATGSLQSCVIRHPPAGGQADEYSPGPSHVFRFSLTVGRSVCLSLHSTPPTKMPPEGADLSPGKTGRLNQFVTCPPGIAK